MALRFSSMQIFESFYQRTGQLKRNLSLGSFCLGSICIGLILGWPESSVTYFLLHNCNGNCSDVLLDDGSTSQMLMSCGGCLGALVPSCIADTYGRRFSFALAGSLNFVFWAIILIFEGYRELILVSAIGGFAAGIFGSTVALYVSEISLPHTRGSTGALGGACAYVGTLFGSCLIFVTFLRIIAFVMICLVIFFLASLHWWMVESPYFLFLQGKTLDAKVALKTLRGATTLMEIDPEYNTIEMFFRISRDATSLRLSGNKKCCSSWPRKRINATLVIVFLCVTQMVGAYGMNVYAKKYLDQVLPAYRRIILSSLGLVSVWTCFWIIDRVNRRSVLFVISIFGSSISCLMLALLTLAGQSIKNRQACYVITILLPASLLAFYYIIYILGLTPIFPVLTGEIFPSRYKTIAVCICISFIYLSSMLIQFFFELVYAEEGYHLTFASFAIFGALGIPFTIMFLPETQGKSLCAIQDEFSEFTLIIN